MSSKRVEISADQLRAMIALQFPQWQDLPISPVESVGRHNRMFRIGETMAARLPCAEMYASQVPKEQRWLPALAPDLPLPIPTPIALGMPTRDYPWAWTICRWLPGESVTREKIADLPSFAVDLAWFLRRLREIPAKGGPVAGVHNFSYGGDLATYDEETHRVVAMIRDEIDSDRALAIWRAARSSSWQGPPVWLHGDVTEHNMLVADGRLAAILDFGCCAIGDPACDAGIAWRFLDVESRAAFRSAFDVDNATWLRACAWALWRGLDKVEEFRQSDPDQAVEWLGLIEGILDDRTLPL